MAKPPNITTAPTGSIAPFGLRMLPALREKIEAAAKQSGRSMNAEVVSRLEASFGSQAGADWELRVALHINEVRLETVQTHKMMAEAHIENLARRLADTAGSGASPAVVRDLQDEVAKAKQELDRVEVKRAKLMEEGERLDRARRNSDRQVLGVLDKIADGAMQEDLRELHALEERIGTPADVRNVVTVPPEKRKNALLAVGMDAYKAMLDEALASRDAQLREWWMNEFGYDPQAPKVEREQSKGPRRSTNAKRVVPRKK